MLSEFRFVKKRRSCAQLGEGLRPRRWRMAMGRLPLRRIQGKRLAAMDAAVRDAVRIPALRELMRTLTDPSTTAEPVRADAQRVASLLVDGLSERGIASALGLTLDEVRATLVTLAR